MNLESAKSRTESEALGWVARGHQGMPIENKMFQGVSGKLLEIHKNERCDAVNFREWEHGADT